MTTNASNAVILLCPGQGAQHVGMGKAWREQSSAAAATFAEADQVLGFPLSKLCADGPEHQLSQTDYSQVALYTTAVASYRGMVELGLLEPSQVIAVAGLSLGEFTALHLAGAFDFASGLRLVRLRGKAMQAAAVSVPSSMVALIGADEDKAATLCDAARESEVLVPANFNAPGQIVISGSQGACQRAAERAKDFGLVAKPLVVAGAFHSPIMQPAATQLAAALDEVHWSQPRIPVISNVTAQPHGSDISVIKKLLVDQLTSPVRWSQSMQWAIGSLQGRFVELAPQAVLSGLMRRIDRKLKVENFAEPPKPAKAEGASAA